MASEGLIFGKVIDRELQIVFNLTSALQIVLIIVMSNVVRSCVHYRYIIMFLTYPCLELWCQLL